MLWQLINLATAGATLALALYAVRSLNDLRTLFVIVAIWSRYALSSFDEYTTSSIAAGFSIISLSSIAVTLIGLALVPSRFYLRSLYYLWPLLFLMAIVFLSGLINSEFGGLVKDMMKWLYFIAISLLLYRAFEMFDPEIVLRGLFAATLTPLLLQFISIGVGRGSFDATIGKVVYIGGYGSSAAFSLSLFTTLCIGALIKWRYSFISLFIALICVSGIYIAQYRTTILAALPLMGIMVSVLMLHWTPKVLRPLSLLYVLVGGIGAVGLAIQFVPPKFLDIVVVLQSVTELMQAPEFFTPAERELFSGRIYIWSQYLTAWWDAPAFVHVLGFGPEAWEGMQEKYAHNTFVSYLYEFGVLGLVALFVFFFTQLVTVTLVRPVSLAWQLMAALLGFLIANLATMPLWLIEGLILLAVLCALSWAKAGGREPRAAAAKGPIGARWTASLAAQTAPRAAGGRPSGRVRAVRRGHGVGATASTHDVNTLR